ncbi:uncharacterized protein K02A2.6-like [Trichonephila clavipes]|nr:uncharacterized protein K02A2.6-like [Trichonephila clavipes]
MQEKSRAPKIWENVYNLRMRNASFKKMKDQILPVTISVVRNSCTNYDLIIGCDVIKQLDIALTDDEPKFHKPRRLPFAERDIVDPQVDKWVENRIVEPCSSLYASQVVVVKKKDGKSRVCFDYRRLNRKLIKDNYHLP